MLHVFLCEFIVMNKRRGHAIHFLYGIFASPYIKPDIIYSW